MCMKCVRAFAVLFVLILEWESSSRGVLEEDATGLLHEVQELAPIMSHLLPLLDLLDKFGLCVDCRQQLFFFI